MRRIGCGDTTVDRGRLCIKIINDVGYRRCPPVADVVVPVGPRLPMAARRNSSFVGTHARAVADATDDAACCCCCCCCRRCCCNCGLPQQLAMFDTVIQQRSSLYGLVRTQGGQWPSPMCGALAVADVGGTGRRRCGGTGRRRCGDRPPIRCGWQPPM